MAAQQCDAFALLFGVEQKSAGGEKDRQDDDVHAGYASGVALLWRPRVSTLSRHLGLETSVRAELVEASLGASTGSA
ncbi:hypothetical protein D3C71_1778640 [compost metagenome]